MTTTYKNLLFNGRLVDLTVAHGRIDSITPATGHQPSATSLILAPAFYNGHTHLAMSLLRGYADDLQLMPWLQDHIWPAEAHLSDEIVYAGTRLAICEMIRSGCVFANDMYWFAPAVARAADEMGIRAAISIQTIETRGPGKNDPRNIAANKALENLPRAGDDQTRVFAVIAAHAIYTVCESTLRGLADQARAEDSFLHVHVSETAGEVETCRKLHRGLTPVAYLDGLGMIGPKTIMAHCVHLTDDDIKIIAGRGAVIVENAQSNMKLASGMFRFKAAVEKGGCRAILGTDGASSNNSLSMFSEMKAAALLAKVESGDPTAAPAAKIYSMATREGASAFGLGAGEIRVGAAADFILLRPDALALVPGFNLTSDLVYAADTSCVDTVVCAGRVLMEHGVIPGEAEIIAAARAAAAALTRHA